MDELDKFLSEQLKNLSVSTEEAEKMRASCDYLIGKIYEQFREKIDEVKVFGSYGRGTFLPQAIDPSSDVDLLVVFKDNEYQPATMLKHLQLFADKIYPRSDVSPDYPAVVLQLNHVRFDLVPAYWERNTFTVDDLLIPAPRSKDVKWIATHTDTLLQNFKEKDKEEEGMMVPLLKLIKYLNHLHNKPFEGHMLEGFAISRSYPRKNLSEYVLEFIGDISSSNCNQNQTLFIQQLKECRKNILHLQNGNLNHYALMELKQLFRAT